MSYQPVAATPHAPWLPPAWANREVARLAGIKVNRIRAGSYIAASIVAALAGLMLIATAPRWSCPASSTRSAR